MNKPLQIIMLTFVAILGGIVIATGKGINVTDDFLGDELTWNTVKIELLDVQGLFGGTNILIFGSGKGHVEIALPQTNLKYGKKGEKRGGLYFYSFDITLNRDEIKKLINIFIENDFLAIQTEKRQGVPDEARPRIILTNAHGKKHEISKWANERNVRFDNIYNQLLSIEKSYIK